MNLAWRTVKATGDHFYPTRDHLNLILRTVESDRRSEKSDARSLKSRLEDSESDRASEKSDLATCAGVMTGSPRTTPRMPVEHRIVQRCESGEAAPLDEQDMSFFEFGMDSLMSLDLRNRLQADLELDLPSTLALEHPSIPDLVDYLIADVLPGELFGVTTAR